MRNKNLKNNLKIRSRLGITIFTVLLLLGTLLFTAINVAALSMTDITVAADETTKHGLPRTTVEFTLTYTNNNDVDSAKLRNWQLTPEFGPSTTKPVNWNSTLVNADENLTIPPNGGQRQINVVVRIGEYAEETLLKQIKVSVDVYDASSKIGTKQKIVFVDVDQTYELTVINKTGDPDSKPRAPNGKAIFKFTVKNVGNGEDTISFSTSGPFSAITFSGDSRSMDPFSFANYTMTINNIPEDLAKGTHTTVVNVQSENTSLSPAQHPFDVEIPAQYELSLSLNESKANKEVIPGKSQTFNFTLLNEGNTKDEIKVTYGFKITAVNWNLLLNTQDDFNVEKDQTKNIQLEVSAPDDQSYPFTVPIYVNCSSQNNLSIYQNTTVNAKIVQVSKIKLNIPPFRELNLTTMSTSFLITVTNDGNGEDTINLDPIPSSLFPSGETWSYDFEHNGVSISSIDVPSKDSKQIYLNITGPTNPKKGTFKLYVNASSENDPSKTVSVSPQVSVKERYNIQIIPVTGTQYGPYPGDTVSVQIRGENVGNEKATFFLGVDIPSAAIGWSESPVFDPSTFVDLQADQIRTSYLNITVDNNAQQGIYIFTVNATAKESGGKTHDSFQLTIKVKRKYDIEFGDVDNTTSVDPGQMASFNFDVQNRGTGSCNVSIDAIYESYMNVQISPSKFELPTASAIQTVWVNITPNLANPLAPMNESGSKVIVNADIDEKEGGPEVSENFWVRINQIYAIDLDVSTYYVNIAPGTSEVFSITVTNDGNGEDRFSILPTPPIGRTGWRATPAKTSTTPLAQGEFEEIEITVEIPSVEAAVSDDVTINVTSLGDESVSQIKLVRIKVEETKGVKFGSFDEQKEVEPGSYVVFDIVVENTGTINDNYSLEITSTIPEFLDYEPLPSNMEISASGENFTQLNVSISDEDVESLPTHTNLTLKVTSKKDKSIFAERQFTLIITAVRDVRLSSPDRDQEGKPNQVILYNISIENAGTGKDKFKLSIIPNPPYSGWAKIKDVAEFTDLLDPGETTYATVEVKIPAKQQPSPPYGKVTILAESKENPTKNNTIDLAITIKQVFKLQVTSVPEKQTVDPGENATFQLNVKNTGTGQDTVELDYDVTNDIDSIFFATFSTYNLVLSAGETKTVDFTITAIKEPEAGKLNPKINIIVESLNDTAETPAKGQKEIVVEINPTVDIELQVDKIKQDVTPNLRGTKAEVTYIVKVYNRGLDGDTFDISEFNNHGFIVEISPTTTSKIEPDNFADVNVKIKVDNNAPMSTLDYNTTITVTSRTNEDKFETIVLKLRIKQTFGVELQVKETDTVETEDTITGNNRIVTFLVGVQNIGTGVDTFKLELLGDYSSWASLNNSYFTLDKKVKEEFSVKVKVPRETSVGEYDLTLRATSRGDDDIYDSADATDEQKLTVSVTQFYEVKLDAIGEVMKTGEPGDTIDFTISVTNRANGDDRVRLDKSSSNSGWLWTLSQRTFTLTQVGDPNENDKRDIKVSVDIPTDKNGKTGFYNISLTIYSTNTPEGDIKQNGGTALTLTVKVDPVYDVDLILDYPTSSDDQKEEPGKDIDYRVTIKNKGNIEDTFKLSVTGSKSGWVDLPYSSIIVGAFKSRTINFTIEIPTLDDVDADEVEAKKYEITLRATSEGNADEYTDLTISPTVDKKYDVEFESSDISDGGDVKVNPNADPEYETFTLTVTNKGNSRDTITIRTKESSDWVIRYKTTSSSATTASITLDISRSETITVQVYAPSDAENGDSKTLTIESKSGNGKITATYRIVGIVETAKIVFRSLEVSGDKSAGSKVTVSITVVNDGDVEAEDIQVKFYDKGKLIHTEEIDELSKKSETDIQFTYELDEGDHKIEAQTSWSDTTIKKSQSFTSETELLSGTMLWILILAGMILIFIIGAALAAASYRRSIPPELREEIAMAKQAARMGKSPEEIREMRAKRFEKPSMEKKKPTMGEKGLEEEKETPAKKAPKKGVRIKCPKCDKIQMVTTTKRPIEFSCPNCGMKLVLKK